METQTSNSAQTGEFMVIGSSDPEPSIIAVCHRLSDALADEAMRFGEGGYEITAVLAAQAADRFAAVAEMAEQVAGIVDRLLR